MMSDVFMKDYYKILGVDGSADDGDLKRAFRRLAFELHPDRNGGDSVGFMEVKEAYDVLSDRAKRREYDLSLRAARTEKSIIGDYSINNDPGRADVRSDIFAAGSVDDYEPGSLEMKIVKAIYVDLSLVLPVALVGALLVGNFESSEFEYAESLATCAKFLEYGAPVIPLFRYSYLFLSFISNKIEEYTRRFLDSE